MADFSTAAIILKQISVTGRIVPGRRVATADTSGDDHIHPIGKIAHLQGIQGRFGRVPFRCGGHAVQK